MAVLAALVYWDWVLWNQPRNPFPFPFGEDAWTGQFSPGAAIFFILGLTFEAILAGIIVWGIWLAQVAEPSEQELSIANLFIFILMTIGALISEIFLIGGSVPFGMPGWIFALLVLLMSIAIIYGTWIWLWTKTWVLARRLICTVVIPVIARWAVTLYDTIEACLQWSVRTYRDCASWGTQTSRTCSQWSTQTSNVCRSWGTSTTRSCLSWLPAWLGWICLAWNVVVQTVCLIWEVVTATVCLAWLVIVQIVCLAFILVTIAICLAWTVIVFPIVVVLMVVIGLMRISFFC